MKGTVKPSPITVIIIGAAAVLSVCATFSELVSTGSNSPAAFALNAILIGAFIFFFIKFRSQSKIYFDEISFTVDSASYRYDEVTEATVKSEQILRGISTLRVTLFKGEEEIASFTKADSGGKEFIDVMKKHGVSVSIDI